MQVRQSQWDLDYSRIASKPLFRKLLTRIDEVGPPNMFASSKCGCKGAIAFLLTWGISRLLQLRAAIVMAPGLLSK